MQPVGEILKKREPVGLPATATALEAAQRMHAERIGALLVFDEAGEVVGIFTERDLMTRVVVIGRDAGGVGLREVMTPDPFTVGPEVRTSEARREMVERHIRHLPVLEGGRPIGMLSLRDLFAADLHETEQQVDAITSYIQGGLIDPENPPAAEEG